LTCCRREGTSDLPDAHQSIISQGPMIIDGAFQVFWVGFGGAILAELVVLYELRHNAWADMPTYLKNPFYWVLSAAMALAGGGLTCLYGLHNVQGLLAVNIGASAPLIIRSFASSAPKAAPKVG
jgi:hypothetical protein